MPDSDTLPNIIKKPSGVTMVLLLLAGLTGGGGIGTLVTGAASGERLAVLEERTKSIEKTVERIDRTVEALKSGGK